MAAPSYTEDLTDIDLAETTTGYFAIGGGGAGLGTGADLSMQGNLCVDKQITAADKGMGFDNGSGISMGANDHIWIWGFLATPGLADTLAAKGFTAFAGTDSSNYVFYHMEGSDTYGAIGRVGKCYVLKYLNTSSGSHPYRTLQGSPGASSPRVFGVSAKTTGTVKGTNLGLDAQRYGTGAYLTAGELISAGDASDNPCTFSGFSTQNDTVSNRWGILTNFGGGNYELQGRFVIGQNNSGTPTLARFKASNVNISLVDTFHAASDFTQFIVDHASTRVEWTNVNITALGTINPGRFVVNSANPTVVVVGGTWTGLGISTLRSNTTLTGKTWRNCGQITQNGGTITNCFVDGTTSTAAILSDNPGLITGTDFPGGGTGHAVRCDTIGTYSWTGNTDTGYTGTRGSNLTSSSGSSDAMFYNNSGGLITLNVAGGGQSPSVRNGAGATTQVNASFTLTLTGLASGVDLTIVNSSTRTELKHEVLSGTSTTYAHSGGETVDILLNSTAYDPNLSDIYDLTLPTSDSSIKFQLIDDLNYENP